MQGTLEPKSSLLVLTSAVWSQLRDKEPEIERNTTLFPRLLKELWMELRHSVSQVRAVCYSWASSEDSVFTPRHHHHCRIQESIVVSSVTRASLGSHGEPKVSNAHSLLSIWSPREPYSYCLFDHFKISEDLLLGTRHADPGQKALSTRSTQ